MLPGQATIQSPVAPAGLVQWAEPSTYGEAFIALNPSNRDTSAAIWLETGRRLAMLSTFATGGITPGGTGDPRMDALDNALGHFVDTIHQSAKGLDDVNQSLKSLRGGDLDGLNGLARTFRDMQPVVAGMATGFRTAASAARPGLPTRAGVRDALRGTDVHDALERGSHVASAIDAMSHDLGVEGGIPWLQTAATWGRHASTLHGYFTGRDQRDPEHWADRHMAPPPHQPHPSTVPHTFLGAPHGEPHSEPGRAGGGSTSWRLGSLFNVHIDHDPTGKVTDVHNAATDWLANAKVPGMGVLDNIINKYPQAAGDYLNNKLRGLFDPHGTKGGGGSFSGGGFLPGRSDSDNLLGHIPGFGIFGLAGGEGIIKSKVAQLPWVRVLVNKLNNMPGYQGGTENAGAGYAFVDSMEGTPYSQANRDYCV